MDPDYQGKSVKLIRMCSPLAHLGWDGRVGIRRSYEKKTRNKAASEVRLTRRRSMEKRSIVSHDITSGQSQPGNIYSSPHTHFRPNAG